MSILPEYDDRPIGSYGNIDPAVIVVHKTIGDKDNGADAVAFMFSRDDGIRWHWTIGYDGSVYRHAGWDEMMAHALGINAISVGIEHDMGLNDRPSEKMLDASARIIAAFCRHIGRKPSRDFIVGHVEDNSRTRLGSAGNNWTAWGGDSSHTDPGPWPWDEHMALIGHYYDGEDEMTDDERALLLELKQWRNGVQVYADGLEPDLTEKSPAYREGYRTARKIVQRASTAPE